MTEGDTGWDALTDEELVAYFKPGVDAGELPYPLVVQVEARGIECLASDPDMKETVSARMESSLLKWQAMAGAAEAHQAKMRIALGSEEIQRSLSNFQAAHEAAARMADLTGVARKVSESVIPVVSREPAFDMEELAQALARNSPASHHGELIRTLEIGFGAVQEELAEHSTALSEMRTSLKRVEHASPGKAGGRVLFYGAITAAVSGVVAAVTGVVALLR